MWTWCILLLASRYPHHNKQCATLCLTSQPFTPSPRSYAGAHLLTFATHDTWRLHWPLRINRVQTLHDSTNSCFAQNPFITHIIFLIMIISDDRSIVIVLHLIFSFCLRRKCHPWLHRKSSPGPSEEEQKYKWIISAFHFQPGTRLEMEVEIDTADTSPQHFRYTFVRYLHKQIKHAKRFACKADL